MLLLAGLIIAFAHNAFSVNGINPFREVGEVPVLTGADPADSEGIRVIDLADLEDEIAGGAILIDARTKPEYEEGRIPGAILIDYYEMGRYLKELLPTLDPARRTIVYCYGPDCEDAELLARELFMIGFTDLLVFKGGFEEWVDSGRDVEGGEGL